MNPASVKRPKVCHIMHDGTSRGGGGTFALTYFPRYHSHFDTFAIIGKKGDLVSQLRERGVRTFALGMDRPWRTFFSWPLIWNILRREKPEVVIVHGQWGGMFGICAARAAGVPIAIYYTHFPSFYTDWDLFRIIRNRLAETITCQLAAKIVCLSQSSRYQYLLRQLTKEEKFLYIPNAVLPPPLVNEADRQQLRRELDLPDEKEGPLVLSMGRLADQKRVDWLLHAWALVEARDPKARLIIVGGGPEEAALHRLTIELSLKRCSFLGSRSKGYRYYQFANIGIICSMFEGLSIALIEAMSCSCPMIGTHVDGIAEAIDPSITGLLVPPADPKALAEAILTLLADPARARQMGEAGRQRAIALYDANKILERQIQLVKDELAKSAQPSSA